MRAGELQGRMIRTEGGRPLGRVVEIHLRDGEVTALTCGGGGFLQRYLASRRGHRVAWTDVLRITAEAIIVAEPRPKGKS